MHHFLSLLLVIIGLFVSVQTRIFRSVLTVPNGVRWGTWDEIKMCPSETYAIGRPSSDDIPSGDDNEVLTGIRLYCTSILSVLMGSYVVHTSVQSEVERFNCSREKVLEGDSRSRGICGFSTLKEGPQGNRTYKNVRMYCCD
uniref:Uncharacterized protein n=1 Tax=Sinocyclocheilus anshuiensis TaxID=1608454 RepID=A0A671P3X2_9TELE